MAVADLRRAVFASVLIALMATAAGGETAKKCRRACGAMIDACAAVATGFRFGDVAAGCRKAVIKQCRRNGLAACADFCGDGTIGADEDCDGANLNGATCTSKGFASGKLRCTRDCRFYLAGCEWPDPTCGNGVAEASEACDGADLHGRTCQREGFAYGMLACAGDCTFDAAGCTNTRFVDNGDGTIVDRQTGLQWEKKSDDDSVHDFDNVYGWSTGTPWVPTGTAFTEFLPALNICTSSSATGPLQGGFAGHCDWRIPTIVELMSILDLGAPGCDAGAPCVPSIFHTGCTPGCTVTTCSCTKELIHWSFTTGAMEPNSRWVLSFFQGSVAASTNMFDYNVRAVRRAE